MINLTSTADRLLGDALSYKKLIPATIPPFKYPPQVQAGIDALSQFGIKVPSDTELLKQANDIVSPYLKGIQDFKLDGLIPISELTQIDDILQKIEWLF